MLSWCGVSRRRFRFCCFCCCSSVGARFRAFAFSRLRDVVLLACDKLGGGGRCARWPYHERDRGIAERPRLPTLVPFALSSSDGRSFFLRRGTQQTKVLSGIDDRKLSSIAQRCVLRYSTVYSMLLHSTAHPMLLLPVRAVFVSVFVVVCCVRAHPLQCLACFYSVVVMWHVGKREKRRSPCATR